MRVENFRGIEFVRISSLPEDQKQQIWQSFKKEKIIRIIQGDTLLNDCILYHDYLSWLDNLKGMASPIHPNNETTAFFNSVPH